jgi:hypothetical protein
LALFAPKKWERYDSILKKSNYPYLLLPLLVDAYKPIALIGGPDPTRNRWGNFADYDRTFVLCQETRNKVSDIHIPANFELQPGHDRDSSTRASLGVRMTMR